MKFVLKTQGGAMHYFNSIAEAHARLGFYAAKYGLELHIHVGTWVDSSVSTAYSNGGDPILHAQALVRLKEM